MRVNYENEYNVYILILNCVIILKSIEKKYGCFELKSNKFNLNFVYIFIWHL